MSTSELFRLEPEVAGGIGPRSVIKRSPGGAIDEISTLEYVFNGWMGDELLETHPCFIVTERLARDLERETISGARFGEVLVDRSEEFFELEPEVELPPFRRLFPEGKARLSDERVLYWSGHDICLMEPGYLVVSPRCLKILKRHKIDHCDVHPLRLDPNGLKSA